MDTNGSFKTHIDKFRIKLSRNVGIMQHLRHHLSYHPMRCIYFSLIHSYTNYCAIVYANTFKTHLHPLQVLKNKALRTLMSYLPALSFIPDSSSTKSTYKNLNILLITSLISFTTVLFAVKYNENLLPSLLQKFDLLPLESTHPSLLKKIHYFTSLLSDVSDRGFF